MRIYSLNLVSTSKQKSRTVFLLRKITVNYMGQRFCGGFFVWAFGGGIILNAQKVTNKNNVDGPNTMA